MLKYIRPSIFGGYSKGVNLKNMTSLDLMEIEYENLRKDPRIYEDDEEVFAEYLEDVKKVEDAIVHTYFELKGVPRNTSWELAKNGNWTHVDVLRFFKEASKEAERIRMESKGGRST